MKHATAKTQAEPTDIEDLEDTIPMATLNQLLQDSAAPEGPAIHDGQALGLLLEQLAKLATLSESIDGKLGELVELLKLQNADAPMRRG